jgi:hypothetical protein
MPRGGVISGASTARNCCSFVEGDISASMRARLHNDKQIIDSIRSEYMRLKTEEGKDKSLYSNFSE